MDSSVFVSEQALVDIPRTKGSETCLLVLELQAIFFDNYFRCLEIHLVHNLMMNAQTRCDWQSVLRIR